MRFLNRIIAFLLSMTVAVPAFAAVTFTTTQLRGPYSVGGYSKMATAVLDLYGTYETGGFTLTPGSIGFSSVEVAIVNPTDGYGAVWSQSNGKVILSSAGVELSNGQSVSATDVNVIMIGQ